MTKRTVFSALALSLALCFTSALSAQMQPTTPRGPDEGEGPFDRFIIRGAMMIDGTGAPPRGPVDIVVEGDRIASVRSVGFPGVPISDRSRPQGATYEIDAHGMYVLPGFIDMHVHTGGVPKAPQAEYIYKLWLAHGVTTTRGVPHGNMEWALQQKALAERNEIVAPR
ncbi:MAG: amidohydrolase, partial [Gemmatimonadetes bacterium]|nr:amidohydrolase [Gemmatimonadota bacterium]